MYKAIIQDGVILGVGRTHEDALQDASDWMGTTPIEADDVAPNTTSAKHNQAAFIDVDAYVYDDVRAGDPMPALVAQDGFYTTERGASERLGRATVTEQDKQAARERIG